MTRSIWSFQFGDGDPMSFEAVHSLNETVALHSPEALGRALAEALGCPLQPTD